VANNSDNTVSVINTATNTVVATVQFGEYAQDVAITASGAFAYVLLAQGVAVINTATNTLVTTVSVPCGSGVNGPGIAIAPNGAFVYVSGCFWQHPSAQHSQ
jgi:YVTN family beta-propeller protein